MSRADEPVPERWTASTAYPDMWVDPAEDPREEGGEMLGERTTLAEFLRVYRLTLAMKCADLDPVQLASRSVSPSSMSLLGLLRHMAEVERYWFSQVMSGEQLPGHERAGGDRDGAWDGAVADPVVVAQAWAAWREEVGAAERYLAEAEDLAVLGQRPGGESIPLRAVLVHMIEEYARHCGHADLLRERIDGRTGQ
ncbi:MAG: DinB family protein [Mycobacteriales bacterium]